MVGTRQNALLAEIIKVNNPHPSVLLNVIAQNHYAPRLEEIPLPAGQFSHQQSNAYTSNVQLSD